MSVTSGRMWRQPFARYDPAASSWRTSPVTSLWDLTLSSLTLPRWGSMRCGELFELPTPALPTVEPGSSSLLPTPAVNDMGAGKTVEGWDDWTEAMRERHGNGNGHGKSLAIEAQRLLPTPTASDANGPGQHGTGGADLRTTLLPTPAWGDHRAGPTYAGGNPTLPGAVTNLPSDAGNTSPDAQRHAQLSLDEPDPD